MQGARRINVAALVEAVLLGGLGVMLLLKASGGVLAYYIHPRYAPLVIAGAVVLLIVAAVRARSIVGASEPVRGRWPGYLLLLLPLLIGLVVPAHPLGADALPADTTVTSGAGQGGIPLDGDTADWTLLQWGTALAVGGRDIQGATVDVTGFVYQNPQRPFAGFTVARYAIVCCIADVKGIGVPVAWPAGADLPVNGWVRVRGTLGRTTIGGQETPAILAQTVETVAQPTEPYLYR